MAEKEANTTGRRPRWLFAILAIAMMAAACTSTDGDGDGDGGGDGGDGGGDPGALTVSNCREVDLPDHVDGARIFEQYIVIDNGVDLVNFDEAQAAIQAVGGTVVDLSQIVVEDERYLVPPIDRDNYVETLQASPYWQAVNARVSVAAVQGEVDKALLDVREQFPDLAVSPIHRVGFMSHWGAFPGTDPQICNLDGTPPSVEGGASVAIGVVDTGIVNASTVESGAVPFDVKLDTAFPDCQVSHGEFVSNVVRTANPAAKVYASNAFPTTAGLCWESGEDQVIAATALVLLDAGGELDIINYSLGAEAHVASSGDASDSFDPVLTRVGHEVLRNLSDKEIEVYAAAGNAPPVSPIYPAAFDSVHGVQASDASNEPIVWEDKTPLPGTPLDWANFIAPGCDIVAVGTDITAAPNEVVVWSGSSFASPIAAALGRTSSVDHAEMLGTLYASGIPSQSQCVKS